LSIPAGALHQPGAAGNERPNAAVKVGAVGCDSAASAAAELDGPRVARHAPPRLGGEAREERKPCQARRQRVEGGVVVPLVRLGGQRGLRGRGVRAPPQPQRSSAEAGSY
jgi:hypothetical protein